MPFAAGSAGTQARCVWASLFEIRKPSDSTNWSSLRVETAATHASCTTGKSACSLRRRGSRSGEVAAAAQLDEHQLDVRKDAAASRWEPAAVLSVS